MFMWYGDRQEQHGKASTNQKTLKATRRKKALRNGSK